MGKPKRKLTAAEKVAKAKRRQEYQTLFSHGKLTRVRRPPTIEGIPIEDFIRANADPIFRHQEGLWEYIGAEDDHVSREPRIPVLTANGREHVEFITTEAGDDLIVAFAISTTDPGDIMSLILQRTPKYESFLPPEERGVAVSHERIADDERSFATHIVVEGPHVDVATSTRVYKLDIATVDPNERARTAAVLQLMHRHGGFKLALRWSGPR